MNLIILNKDFQTLGAVGMFTTLIWSRRYDGAGMFELHAPASFFPLMNEGRYLYRNDRDELGIVQEVNLTREASGVSTAWCKGYFAEELLNDRVIDRPVNLTGTPEAIGRQLVERFAISPADPARVLQHVALGDSTGVGARVSVTTTGDRLGDKLYEIEKTQELSHRLRYDYLANLLLFEVWQGKDRTDIQRVNSWAIFSDQFYNIKNAIYDRDESEYRNVAYVAGEGEGAARVVVEVDVRQSVDEVRRELYVDARDLQKQYTDENDVEHTYTDAEYQEVLRQRGLEKLAEYEKIEIVNSDVDANANLRYGVDFDLGDLCTYRFAGAGIETTKRITEIQEVYEGSRQTLSVVFGNDRVTSVAQVIRRERS